MTKLIGGNISDTPIKDISDGSAFSAGGGGGVSPKTLSVATTATSISGWDKPWPGMFTRGQQGGTAHCKLDDSNWIFVWRSITDNKVKAAIITFDGNNDPTFGSQTSLTAFTDSTKGPVWVNRVSDTRVLIMSAVEISTYINYQIQVYDISGTTITAASGLSRQDIVMSSSNYDYLAASGSLLVIDENRAVLGTTDYYRNTDSRRYHYGIRFTATQNVGSATDFGTTGPANDYEESGDALPVLLSTSKFMQGDYYSISTVDISADTTPVLSNLVVVNGAQPLPKGSYGYTDERKLQFTPDNPTEPGEFFGMSHWVFGHYSGVSDDTNTLYAPTQGISSFSTSVYAGDSTFMLLSQSGTVHHTLYSQNGGGLNARLYQPMIIDTNDHTVKYGLRVQLSTGINTSTEGLLGGIIRPNTSATRLTVFEYQTAATAGWYYATIDVT